MIVHMTDTLLTERQAGERLGLPLTHWRRRALWATAPAPVLTDGQWRWYAAEVDAWAAGTWDRWDNPPWDRAVAVAWHLWAARHGLVVHSATPRQDVIGLCERAGLIMLDTDGRYRRT